jgi:hypothetical protein
LWVDLLPPALAQPLTFGILAGCSGDRRTQVALINDKGCLIMDKARKPFRIIIIVLAVVIVGSLLIYGFSPAPGTP